MSIVYARASGGHYLHMRDERPNGSRTSEALCGFEPSSNSPWRGGSRGTWRYVTTNARILAQRWICPKCARKLEARDA